MLAPGMTQSLDEEFRLWNLVSFLNPNQTQKLSWNCKNSNKKNKNNARRHSKSNSDLSTSRWWLKQKELRRRKRTRDWLRKSGMKKIGGREAESVIMMIGQETKTGGVIVIAQDLLARGLTQETDTRDLEDDL